MRNNYVNSEPNKISTQPYISSLNKSSAFHSTQQSKSSAISKLYVDSTNEKTVSQIQTQNFRQHSFDKLNQSLSIYENFNFTTAMITGDKTLPVRKSRIFDRSIEPSNRKARTEIKRDLSMPPISAKQLTVVENNIYSQYSVEQNHIKYSIDADLDADFNEFDDSPSVMYDSIITTNSITPPPVHIINTSSTSEYVNRKAIIRPLAFRPVQSVNSGTSPTKPPVTLKPKIPEPKKSSPPPVPPHATRMAMKTNLNRVQSAKSGDSSGYYSSRTTGTLTGTASSTDISPSFDESVSIFDSLLAGEVYSQPAEQPGAIEHFNRESEHDIAGWKLSLDSEIMSERQRGKILEVALTNSNCKLLDAESNIMELKKRLSQKSTDFNKAMESLEVVKRNLEHQSQKSMHLEKTIQSLKLITNERNREYEIRNQATQTVQFMNDLSANKLLEQFEEERKIWLEEKCKVLTYQRQIESNFQQLLIKCRRLETHVLHMKSQLKDSRRRPSVSANHSEDHDKSSTNSVDSSNRNYFTNVSRIEVTEHQSSF